MFFLRSQDPKRSDFFPTTSTLFYVRCIHTVKGFSLYLVGGAERSGEFHPGLEPEIHHIIFWRIRRHANIHFYFLLIAWLC